MMNKNVFVFLGLLGISFVLLIVAIALPKNMLFDVIKLALLLLAGFFDILAFSSKFYLYAMGPLAKGHSKHVILNDQNPYFLSSTADAVLQKDGDDFIATVYIHIPLYTSATEMSEEEKISFSTQVSKLVGISNDPVRFTAEMYVMNKDAYIQKLRDTINEVENEEAKLVNEGANPAQIEVVRGRSSMWKKMLDNISKTTSLELVSFAALSARGSKEFEAVNIAQQKARELMAGIGSTLGVSPSLVTGNELLKFIEPEYLIPFSTISEQITKNIQEQVI